MFDHPINSLRQVRYFTDELTKQNSECQNDLFKNNMS